MVQIDGLANEIEKCLVEYSDEVTEILNTELKKAAKEALKILENHPRIPTMTEEYKRSFKLKKTSGKLNSKAHVFTIYNKKYQLTHLLEKSHAHYGHGTPSGTKTTAYPHWEDAQKAVDDVVDNVINAIQSR